MRKLRALGYALTLATLGLTAGARAATDTEPPTRVEARSTELLAVGVVQGDRMVIHISRALDNAPVRAATVTVALRGNAYPAVAETDGSFTLQTHDLQLPGTAAVEFRVVQAAGHETLKGTLQIASSDSPLEEQNSVRQLGWWVLNFAVCIGFLWLISRRRKINSLEDRDS